MCYTKVVKSINVIIKPTLWATLIWKSFQILLVFFFQINESYVPLRVSSYDINMARWLQYYPLKQFHIIEDRELINNQVKGRSTTLVKNETPRLKNCIPFECPAEYRGVMGFIGISFKINYTLKNSSHIKKKRIFTSKELLIWGSVEYS